MRVLGEKVVNEMVIADAIGGMEVTFFYRTPTTKDRQTYLANLWIRSGDDVEDTSGATRQYWAKQILTNIGEDCFGLMDAKSGETKPFSSDPESEDYRADWKELICQYAPDLVELFALRVFEGSRQIPAVRKPEALDSKN